MDMVLKLRELRRSRGLSQREVAKRSGLGVKTISSFETGSRIGSLKLDQLRRILKVYGVSERDFFSEKLDRRLALWEAPDEDVLAEELIDHIRELPGPIQKTLLSKFRLMISTATDLHAVQLRPGGFRSEWQLMTSRN
ncbi:MAG TPA: helix-turn-helix transcriptional regulator [Thermoanaerobaculia bacterium]|nr:helix-turn-helix transcriptional regulator [Thermoanaerobaculia bacterium]